MYKYNKGHAEKTTKFIEGFFKIAKTKHRDGFDIHPIDVDMSIPFHYAMKYPFHFVSVFTFKEKGSGKKIIFVSYLRRKGDYKEPTDTFNLLYHTRLLHEYAQVFLFYDYLINPPSIGINYSEKENTHICNQFANLILNFTGLISVDLIIKSPNFLFPS